MPSAALAWPFCALAAPTPRLEPLPALPEEEPPTPSAVLALPLPVVELPRVPRTEYLDLPVMREMLYRKPDAPGAVAEPDGTVGWTSATAAVPAAAPPPAVPPLIAPPPPVKAKPPAEEPVVWGKAK